MHRNEGDSLRQTVSKKSEGYKVSVGSCSFLDAGRNWRGFPGSAGVSPPLEAARMVALPRACRR